MRKRGVARRSRRKPEEQATPSNNAPATHEQPGPFYNGGPALSLERNDRAPHAASVAAQAEPSVAPLPTVQGTSPSHREVAYSNSVRLQGRTDADFGGSTFRTSGVRVTAATGCANCADSDCVRATGTLISTFRVRTTITLPSVDDFPNLTACQRRRVRDAITNVLAPHEQQHVDAFRTYNGTTRTPFDLTICRADFDSPIREMFNTADQARQDAARVASAALDPFHFDVDLDCQERAQTEQPEAPTAELPVPPDELA